MLQGFSLKDHFLVATPALEDQQFEQSLIYVCEHTQDGAMGLVVNMPLSLSIDEMLVKCGINSLHKSIQIQDSVFDGGPLQQTRGFILHNHDRSDWKSTAKVSKQLQVTTSKDILEAIASDKGPQNCLITLGYSGWNAGQLEVELKEDSWLCLKADLSIIFEIPATARWRYALQRLGVNPVHYVMDAGHA